MDWPFVFSMEVTHGDVLTHRRSGCLCKVGRAIRPSCIHPNAVMAYLPVAALEDEPVGIAPGTKVRTISWFFGISCG